MYCSKCGRQTAAQDNEMPRFCSSCGAAFATQTFPPRAALVRPIAPRMIAGVCSGIAIHQGWDLTLVRVLFVALTLITSGCAVLFYLAAWIMIPEGVYAAPQAMQYPGPQPTSVI